MDRELFLESLLGLMAIDSVAMTDPDERHPYGTGPAKALSYMLELCGRLGIRTENRDGKVAWAEIGQGEEIVGILCHLDIVPVGSGWEHDPKGEICGDRLYGRGCVDDKGPAMAVLFAMKELQDAGVCLKRRVRLIFGQNEETGDWEDMQYYREHEDPVAYGFTPDADFPAIYGEKGILNFELRAPLEGSGFVKIQGGEAANMVPDGCTAQLEVKGRIVHYEAEGRSAHASTPEKGCNAISALMEQLGELEQVPRFAEFYNRHIGWDFSGKKMGCGFWDEQSGNLTMNAGKIRTENGEIVLELDIRNPVTYTEKQVEEAIEKACRPYGISVSCTHCMDPIYMDKNSRILGCMLEVYREVTGDDSQPMVIGGGTYARAMPGIVAFGPMQPGRECTEHQKDEYILLKDLYQAEEIYRETIRRLANFEDNMV